MKDSSEHECDSSSLAINNDWAAQLAPRLQQQLDFLVAVDALKQVNRASRISDNSRTENSAEHSWHLTLFALLLSEYADDAVDTGRVVTMLIVHDIVEIDAGDVPLHAPQQPDQSMKEQAAATRLFGLLPEDQAQVLKQYWEEFEHAESADAKFAKAVDRLQPVLLNMLTGGGTWSDYKVSFQQLVTRTSAIEKGSDTLWQCVNAMFDDALKRGWLKTDPPTDSS